MALTIIRPSKHFSTVISVLKSLTNLTNMFGGCTFTHMYAMILSFYEAGVPHKKRRAGRGSWGSTAFIKVNSLMLLSHSSKDFLRWTRFK